MAELRYNPLTRDWLMVASHRQERTALPPDFCPFCPGSGRVPAEGFDVFRYQNDFPALSVSPPLPDAVSGELFAVQPAYGRCEVLLYSDKHDACLAEITDGHAHTLARMWCDVYRDFAEDENIKYVYLFENRGDIVGQTITHPHGQAYGYPFVPQRMRIEAESARAYFDETGECLFCQLLENERADGRRIVFENEHFCVYLPFFGQTAYGVNVTAKRHVPNIGALTDRELDALGEVIRDVSAMYDVLFDKPYPYMMCMHNAPTDGASDEFCHFYVEFIALLHAAEKQQFFASSESGAGAWCNPTAPEEKALELREAVSRCP